MSQLTSLIIPVSIIFMAASTWLAIRIMRTSKSRRINIVVRGDHANHQIQRTEEIEKNIRAEDSIITEKIDGHEYRATIKEAYTFSPSFIDNWWKGITNEYLVLFHEYKAPDKKSKEPEPEYVKAVSTPAIPENTAEILLKVKYYRGVNEGLEKQFQSQSSGVIPDWILIVIVAIVAIAVLIIAYTQGWLSPTAIEDFSKKSKLMAPILWRLYNG